MKLKTKVKKHTFPLHTDNQLHIFSTFFCDSQSINAFHCWSIISMEPIFLFGNFDAQHSCWSLTSADNNNVNKTALVQSLPLLTLFLITEDFFSSGLNKAEEAFDLVMFAHPEIIHLMPTDCTGNYHYHIFLKILIQFVFLLCIL